MAEFRRWLLSALQEIRRDIAFVRKKNGRLRSQKNLILSGPIAPKAGTWRADDRLCWQNTEDRARVERLFFSLYPSRQAEKITWRLRVGARALDLLATSRFRVRSKVRQGPSVVFFSRGGTVKLFDFDNHEVITLITGEIADKLHRARSLPLFDIFLTNDFTIDDSLRATRDLCVKREKLIDAPCMGKLPPPDQIAAMTTICARYTDYVRRHAQPTAPDVFRACIDEVANCLAPDDRAKCLAMKDAYSDFVERARTLPAHLDFNIGNFLAVNELLLLDIEDAGLCLPASYDMNNLVLNEVYEGRSTHLLQAVLNDPLATGYADLLHLTTGQDERAQLGVSLFANFILRESSLVRPVLFGKWRPERVQRNWARFAKSIPGWPNAFVGERY